jgi:hypothetical protein
VADGVGGFDVTRDVSPTTPVGDREGSGSTRDGGHGEHTGGRGHRSGRSSAENVSLSLSEEARAYLRRLEDDAEETALEQAGG